MKIWEVIRNCEKNFTDAFDEVHANQEKYLNIESYSFIKNTHYSNSMTTWNKDSKEFHE